jgi:hypothetical protein
MSSALPRADVVGSNDPRNFFLNPLQPISLTMRNTIGAGARWIPEVILQDQFMSERPRFTVEGRSGLKGRNSSRFAAWPREE